GGFGWYLYFRSAKDRIDIAKVGGVLLVYEVDGARAPADADSQMDALARAVQRRLDRHERRSIAVRPIGNRRIEIAIPRGREDHAALAADGKTPLPRVGKLEFRMPATTHDDADTVERAEEYFKAAALPWQQLLDAVVERWPAVKKDPAALTSVPFD